ncbi:MAG TPA: TIGR00730 family Rossman fold protein [Phycisphaerae bacterium]|nr:TIGR00730 family Rossman fold protein [Phycisphaerae bacterium]
MKSIAVFCGSSLGADAHYALAAQALGQLLADQKISLIYGGGNIGLMGTLATAALNAGAHVTGVIPSFLMQKEIGNIDLPDLRIVNSMHDRKALMADLADGFIALPGGFGTLEEFCEILTWAQLGLHQKPFGLLNVAGFYDHFLAFIDNAVARQLIKPKHRRLLMSSPDPAELLALLQNFQPPGPTLVTAAPSNT